MSDGISIYFGEGGGNIADIAHGKFVASSDKFATDINYGSGLYEHLNYLPDDIKIIH